MELPSSRSSFRIQVPVRVIAAAVASAVFAMPAAAAIGDDPWTHAVDVLMAAFVGPIAKGLALISIVIGGLMFAFGEGQSKRMFSGIVFGVGMAVGAVNFFNWLFQ